MLWLRKFSDTLTVDQIASLSDGDMVRRRFDTGNIRWVGALSVLALLVALIQMLTSLLGKEMEGHLPPLGVAHFVVAAAGAAFFTQLALAERRRGTWKPQLPVHVMARNLTPWVIAFLLVEFSFLTFFHERNSDAWMVWAMLFPWLLIPVRLDVSRRLALHISLIVVVFISVLVLGTREPNPLPGYAGVTFISSITFLIGAMTSRRIRRDTVEEWSERRKHAREQLRMREELQYAREVQLSMLPETSPVIEWVEVAGTSLPATEVGGDYYDYFVEGGAIAVVCGDVAGHGLASAIVLASLRGGFMLLRDSLHDPASVLQRLNDLVAQTSRRRMLATAAVVRLDRAAGRAIIASAGHPPVIVRRSGAIETIELFAPPLGVRLPYRVPSREMTFARGDLFVLHSDGVYESQNAAGEAYGLERLASIVSSLDGASAAAVRDAIIRDIEAFRGGSVQQDDVTVVVARVV
ncbi:MAG TPA: PP2C family protein-serine/threonine phosphatase [Thermoanaerobaculia bacterium]|nr:PP2C family protein-serine/threonine phosphatase [Thermoanaerobaculia bacterium]